MLEPLVVKATRAVPRREGRSNPPDLSNECERAISQSYPTIYVIINADFGLFHSLCFQQDNVKILIATFLDLI